MNYYVKNYCLDLYYYDGEKNIQENESDCNEKNDHDENENHDENEKNDDENENGYNEKNDDDENKNGYVMVNVFFYYMNEIFYDRIYFHIYL